MDKIIVARGTQQLGEFTEEEVLAGLRSDRFALTDLWWKEGMEKWEPFSTLHNIDAPDLPNSGGNEEIAATIPWENGSLGIVQRIWQTFVGVLTNPWKTFAQMPISGGYGKPFLFMLLSCVPLLIEGVYGPIVMSFVSVENETSKKVLEWFFMSDFSDLLWYIPFLIAFKETHRAEYWRVICAFALSMFPLCSCLVSMFSFDIAGGDLSVLFEKIFDVVGLGTGCECGECE